MLLGARQFFERRGPAVTFLSWVQSDGRAVVDLGFTPTDYRTRIRITASMSSVLSSSDKRPLVMAGLSNAINNKDLKQGFGFAAIYKDRQLYLRVGRSRWWNNAAYSGNWSGGKMHDIDAGLTDEYTATLYLDGVQIASVNESSLSISEYPREPLPTDSQTVFGSKYNGNYYLANSMYKVRRVAYELGGVVLADFRAAEVDGNVGFYDIVSKRVCQPVSGSLINGGDL